MKIYRVNLNDGEQSYPLASFNTKEAAENYIRFNCATVKLSISEDLTGDAIDQPVDYPKVRHLLFLEEYLKRVSS
jgi:hypothetical protein